MHPLADPASLEVLTALARKCRVCNAPKQTHCTNLTPGGGPLPGRLVHVDRTSK